MKAAAYCRVSTEDQAVHGYSLEAQRDECVKHLLMRGYAEYEIYVDDGYSAKDMNRPALSRMLEDVKAKKINYIVFWALDRLTRDPIDGLMMCRETFYKNGIKFASITEEIDMDTADGEMMLTIRLSMARAERRRISERTRIGYAKRAQLGHRNSPARPFGYNIGPNLVLTVNEDEKLIVHKIYNWYIGGYGITHIVRELNILGLPSPRGKEIWNQTAVKHILQNITYLGYNHWKSKNAPEENRIVVKGEHEPLLDEETFNKVQEIMRRRSQKEMNRSSNNFYFSTILKCAVCGSSFYGNAFNAKGKRVVQYYCAGKRYQGNCTTSNISEPKAARLVLAAIKAGITQNIDTSKEVAAASQGDPEKERKMIEREVTKAKAEMEKLVSLYLADKVDMDIYEKKREQLKEKLTELEQRLSVIPHVEKNQLTEADTIKFLENLTENWEHLEDPERKRLMQSLFKAIKIIKIDGKWRIEEMISALN